MPEPSQTGYAALQLLAPTAVIAHTEAGAVRLTPGAQNQWSGPDGLVLGLERRGTGALAVFLSAPHAAVKQLLIRWRFPAGKAPDRAGHRFLGDAWERGYGDLEWRGLVPDRALPWYFAAHDAARDRTDCVGVQTGANSFCFFQTDPDGMSLWADVRSGGRGVSLGERRLKVCTVSGRAGKNRESSFAAVRAFCREMCAQPRLADHPLYGHNDWYYAYGKNSAESILADARRIVSLSPAGGNRPYCVIDAGWQSEGGAEGGLRERGNAQFPDMAGLAARIKDIGARPGIWIRPLAGTPNDPDTWRLPRDPAFLDPTVPEVRAEVAATMARLQGWGYELIKHDFTTFDITGKWGFRMEPWITEDGWTFAEGNHRTTAEVILDLYQAIREGAGQAVVIGCNTVSHLSAGIFECCRTGDDTSGRAWERTRKMGVNSLAFRAAQHDTFYAADPDCVGVTTALPWSLNRQWLDLVARSGQALFVSLAPDAVGPEQEADLRRALAAAAAGAPLGEPTDWLDNNCPAHWSLTGKPAAYSWYSEEGASPFSV